MNTSAERPNGGATSAPGWPRPPEGCQRAVRPAAARLWILPQAAAGATAIPLAAVLPDAVTVVVAGLVGIVLTRIRSGPKRQS